MDERVIVNNVPRDIAEIVTTACARVPKFQADFALHKRVNSKSVNIYLKPRAYLSYEVYHEILTFVRAGIAVERLRQDLTRKTVQQTPGLPAGMTECKHCFALINPQYADDEPETHRNRAGTRDDPRAPGISDDVCDVCGY